MVTYTLQEAIKKLEHYCAYQERCHQEVRQKLERLSMMPDAIDVVIVHLVEHNFLNEARYAKAFVTGKFRIKQWGRRRLIYELEKKGINKTLINLALLEIEEDTYLEIFNALAEKKTKSLIGNAVITKRKKLTDYLLYRGWERDLVYKKVNAIIR